MTYCNIRFPALLSALLCMLIVGSTTAPAQTKPPKGKTPKVEPGKPAPAPAKGPVLEVGREKFTVDEIAETYKKNANRGGKMFNELGRDSALAFINLFANYRLKVQAALDAGVDKKPEVIADLASNRLQLAVPPAPNTGYLIERKVVDPAVERIFKRRDDELLLALIYVSMRPNDAADTARAYARAQMLMAKVRNGADFAEVAHDSTDDPGTKENGGRLPSYITAGMILPSIEEAAYRTRPGEICPTLVRVPAGYVVLKVLDRSPRMKVRGAHILIAATENDVDVNSPTRKKAEEVMRRLKAGEEFAAIAREVSDDKTSGANGGDFLSYYTRSLGFEARNGKLEREVEMALFKLKDGETSDIVRSRYGYHIVKRLESRRPTFEEEKETIRQFYKQRLIQDDRDAYVRSVIEKHGMKVDESTFDQVLAAVNQNGTTLDSAWAGGLGPGLRGSTMFSYGGHGFSVAAWIDSLRTRQDLRATPLSRAGVRSSIYAIFEQAAMVDEAKNLEQEYPEFAALMRDYRDGILMFDVENEMVWKRLNAGYNDEKGRAFFEKNRSRYNTLPRVGLTEIFLYKDDEVKEVSEKIAKGTVPFDTLATQRTQREGYRDNGGRWGISNAKNSELVAQVLKVEPRPKQGQILPAFQYQGGWSIVRIDSVEAARPMTFDEARTEVQGDFIDNLQKELTKEWIDQLRSKYTVKINDAVLNAALKKS